MLKIPKIRCNSEAQTFFYKLLNINSLVVFKLAAQTGMIANRVGENNATWNGEKFIPVKLVPTLIGEFWNRVTGLTPSKFNKFPGGFNTKVQQIPLKC